MVKTKLHEWMVKYSRGGPTNSIVCTIWKFGRESDVKAWVLLDKSSTHVLPDNAINTIWDVDGFKLRGFKMSHTNADFAL